MRFTRHLLTLSIFSLLFLFAGNLYSKEVNRSYLTEDNTLSQYFSWTGTDTVYRYEFLLEKMDEAGEYQFKDLIDTKETELDMVLGFGKYRYRIKVYNYLNTMDFETDWTYFEIIETHYPVITKVSPTLIYLDESPSGLFTVDGMGYSKDTVFTLENNLFIITPKVMDIDEQGTRARLLINPELLDIGTYYIRAVNPGDLFDTSGTIRVGFYKQQDISVALGYSPMFTILNQKTYDDEKGIEYFNQLFTEKNADPNFFWWMGGNARVTFIPYKNAIFSLGGALNLDGTFINHKFKDYTISAPFYSLCATANMQIILKKTDPLSLKKSRALLTADIHAGAGIFGAAGLTLTYDNLKLDNGKPYQEGPVSSISPCVTVGGDIFYYLTKKMYIDFGANMTYVISPKKENLHILYAKPLVALGWQF